MGDVVMCLLGKSASSRSAQNIAPLEQTPWVEKTSKVVEEEEQ